MPREKALIGTKSKIMEIKDRELHRVSSTAIIRKDEKYLIVRRSLSKKAFPGKWTVPGGGLEVDDYINLPKASLSSPQWYFAVEKSLMREVMEEVGLEVGKFNYLCSLTFILPNGTPSVVLSYYCDWKLGEVKLNEENIDYKWVNCSELYDYDLIEGIVDEIKMVDKILNQKES